MTTESVKGLSLRHTSRSTARVTNHNGPSKRRAVMTAWVSLALLTTKI